MDRGYLIRTKHYLKRHKKHHQGSDAGTAEIAQGTRRGNDEFHTVYQFENTVCGFKFAVRQQDCTALTTPLARLLPRSLETLKLIARLGSGNESAFTGSLVLRHNLYIQDALANLLRRAPAKLPKLKKLQLGCLPLLGLLGNVGPGWRTLRAVW